MNKFKLTVLIAIVAQMMFAQSPSSPVILVSSDKKVVYKDDIILDIIPGSIVKKSGELILSPDSRIVLFYDLLFVEVTDKQSPVNLVRLFGESDELVPQVEAAFGEKMSEAIYSAYISGITMKNEKALVSGWGSKGSGGKDGWGSKGSGGKDGWGSKGSGGKDGWGSKGSGGKDGWGSKGSGGKDGWGSKGSGGKDGWGSKGSGGKDGWGSKGSGGKDGWGESEIKIRSLCPGGNYTEGLNTVYWGEFRQTRYYNFVIEDMDHNIVYSVSLTNPKHTFDTRVAHLEVGKEYAWYVHHPTKREVSTPVFFKVVDGAMAEKSLGDVNKSNNYQKADEVTKLLMQAHQLEEANLFLSANEKYNEAIKLAPDNSLVKMMYAYFCNNMGETESAARALK
ncbi:MAG: hypothetical protein WBO36_03100 [Saprospiraceae bacterium]